MTNKVWLIDDKKLQNFEGGYDQVSPYLDALEIEKELKESTKEAPPAPSAPQPVAAPKVNNNKNKLRLETIYTDIEATESKVKIIEEKIAGLDYTKLADPKNGELKILTDAQSVLEERLLALYQELEELEK